MASFQKYLPLLHEVEGGFQKNPDDPGNYNSYGELIGTNHGISGRFYETAIGHVPTENEMRNITQNQADQIFKEYFWDKSKADKIRDQSVAETVVDHQINAGKGVKLAQKVLKYDFGKDLGPYGIDGVMGKDTLSALNSVDPKKFVKIYNAARKDYYENLGGTFKEGWIKRVAKFAYKHQTLITTGFVFYALGLTALGIYLYKR